jgi:peptidoglycan/LPS O-acetylase OafA/YrhL
MIAVAFPTIVWLGSMTEPTGWMLRAAALLGALSYPICCTTRSIIGGKVPGSGRTIYITALLMVPPVAYAVLRLYDQPIRERLRKSCLDRHSRNGCSDYGPSQAMMRKRHSCERSHTLIHQLQPVRVLNARRLGTARRVRGYTIASPFRF